MNILNRIKNRLFPKFWSKSYSQCGEDLIIDFVLTNYFKIRDVTYLDIGANHPKKINNTYYFYKKGGSGILVEPDRNLSRKLNRARGDRDTILNVGVGAAPGELVFYKMSIDALSSFDKESIESIEKKGIAKLIGKEIVPIISINNLLERQRFNFVSIDVEGIDELIINSWDFERFRPEVICVETVEFTMDAIGQKRDNLISKIKQSGYFVYADTHINSIFVRDLAQ